jgi:hypothetical protein
MGLRKQRALREDRLKILLYQKRHRLPCIAHEKSARSYPAALVVALFISPVVHIPQGEMAAAERGDTTD